MSKDVSIVCMSEELKQRFLESMKKLGMPSEVIEHIGTISKCEVGHIGTAKVAVLKKKRAPSAYNLFIGDCVKEQSDDKPVKDRFSTCVINWKNLSEEKKEEYRERAKKS